MKFLITSAALAAALLVAAPAFAKEHQGKEHMAKENMAKEHMASQHELSAADGEFLKDAAMGNLAEVHMGILATSHGSTPALREFGRWMVSTHSFANRELSSIAETLHGEKPPLKLDAHVADEMGKLENLHGADFDKAFLQAAAANHDKDMKKIGDEAKDGKAPLIKTFAANFLPTVDEHYAQVQLLMAEAKGEDSAGAEKNADMKAAVGGMGAEPKGNTDQAKQVQEQHSK